MMKNKKATYRGSMSLLVMILAILTVTFLYFMDSLSIFTWQLYDQLYEEEGSVNKDIVIVGIDDEAYTEIGRWPFSRRVQGEIFDRILSGNPAVLGIDVIYDAQTDEDDYLVEVLSKGPVVVASTSGDVSYASDQTFEMVEPFEALKSRVESGVINTEADAYDGIVRRIKLSQKNGSDTLNSFAYEIYRTYMETIGEGPIESAFSSKYIDFVGGPSSYTVMSANHVLEGFVKPEFFEGKIVLFGPYALGMQDDYYTPLDKVNKMYGVEIHANIIQNLIDDSFRVGLPLAYHLMLIVACGVLAFYIGRKWSIKISGPLQLLLIFLIFYFGLWVYKIGYVVDVVYPMAVVILVSLINIFVDYALQLTEKRRITGIFGRYVAPQIVEKILEDGEESLKLGGLRTIISVLFVDIRGFTPLSEVAEPEEIVQILNDYLDLCARAIFEHNGTLDKFIGDAAMAIYNAPLPLENHPLHAVKTAWAMKMEGEQLAKKLYEKYGRDVQFGIGVNTGKAIVGNIGSKVRMDYTAIGDTVNVSARLESVAKPGQILISEATYLEVKDYVVVTPLGGIKVKGKQNEIKIYQLDGIQ